MLVYISFDNVLNVLLLLVLVIPFFIIWVKNTVISTILLSIWGILIALLYLGLGAPDVMMIQLLLGCAISSILFMITISIVGSKVKKNSFSFIPLLVVFMMGGILFLTMLGMPQFGEQDAPISSYLTPYYIHNSYQQLGIQNVVTSVLFGYRAFDSLGVVFVVFTAATSVTLLIMELKNKNQNIVKKND